MTYLDSVVFVVEEAASTQVAENKVNVVLHNVVGANRRQVVALSRVDTTLQSNDIRLKMPQRTTARR